MQKDAEEKKSVEAESFKEMIFAHSIVNGNREAFTKLYPEYASKQRDEEWEIPQTPEELQQALSEFHQIAARPAAPRALP
jgi:hypothetical protein